MIAPPLLRPQNRWLAPVLWLLGISAMLVAAYLANEILAGQSIRYDRALLLALRVPGHLDRPIGPTWLTQSMTDLSALGGFTVLWLFGTAGVGLLLRAGRRSEAGWFALSTIGASLLNAALKSWIHRPRPNLVPHLAQVSDASFPSGHAMVSAAVYLTLGIMLGEAWPPGRRPILAFSVLLVVLIGVSRVYLGVHWPSDVIAGWSLGSVWALLMFEVNRRTRRRSTA